MHNRKDSRCIDSPQARVPNSLCNSRLHSSSADADERYWLEVQPDLERNGGQEWWWVATANLFGWPTTHGFPFVFEIDYWTRVLLDPTHPTDLAFELIGEPQLTADLDGDGDTDAADLALLLGSWGPCPAEGDCPADFDGNGTVGPFDLAILLGSWG